jgi:hypothetical protein
MSLNDRANQSLYNFDKIDAIETENSSPYKGLKVRNSNKPRNKSITVLDRLVDDKYKRRNKEVKYQPAVEKHGAFRDLVFQEEFDEPEQIRHSIRYFLIH